jgi:hypothetical protein
MCTTTPPPHPRCVYLAAAAEAEAAAAAAAKHSRTHEPTVSGMHASAAVAAGGAAAAAAADRQAGNHCNQLAGDAAADELDAEGSHGAGNGAMSYAGALSRLVALTCQGGHLCPFASSPFP